MIIDYLKYCRTRINAIHGNAGSREFRANG
jgi:hypothetical protein